MTEPLIPAQLDFAGNGTPFSSRYDDIYHSAIGALVQAEAVFLKGNRLPARWHSRRLFTVMETGFGVGINFLVTWAAWRADPARCERLHFVSTELHPFTRDDLRRALAASTGDTRVHTLAEALVDRWPMLVPGTHRLEFDDGRVTLTLVFGDAARTLASLRLRADAFYLDGFTPAKNPAIWSEGVFRSLARLADVGATFATYTSSGHVKRALEQSGFTYRKIEGFGYKRAMLVGEFAPRYRVRRHEPPAPLSVSSRHAIVIGAGLAGCALVERLAARGWAVTLIDRRASMASDASGNPAGVFHPMLARDDSVGSRISRAGYLYALDRWATLEAAGHALTRGGPGLLQLAEDEAEARAIAAMLHTAAYPHEFVEAVDRDRAAALAGMPVTQAGWFFPQGGWIAPASLCAAQCAAAGDKLRTRFDTHVARLEQRGDSWHALDARGETLADAPVVIVASAHDAARIAGLQYASTRSVRGQLSLLQTNAALRPHLPIVGDGYAVPLTGDILLAGATYEPDDDESQMRASGHAENLDRLARMLPAYAPLATKLQTDAASANLPGRVAFRCVTPDRLPMIGPLADETAARADAARLSGGWPLDLPRLSGAFGAFAYGSRGLVWAALGAELIAAQIEGEPWPLERELAEAADPGRYLLRALRQRELST